MTETVFLKDRELQETTLVDNLFITRFMPDAPDLAVKVYLYGLMRLSCPSQEEEDLTSVFGCTDEDIRAAFSYWEHAGLIEIISGEPLRVRYFSIRNAMQNGVLDTKGAAYGDFVRRLQEVLGTRILTGSELSKVYDWLEVFGIEQPAAIEIVKHCLDKKGARTSVSYMDKVAKTLAGKGAFTLDSVREQFSYEDKLYSGSAAILKSWNQSRLPTEAEIALYEKWTCAWGFDDDGIKLALSRVTAAEKPSFAYVDGILKGWREDGNVDRAKLDEMKKQEDAVAELARASMKRAGLKTSPNAEKRERFRTWYVDWKMSAELIFLAAELSSSEPTPFRSMIGMLEAWHDAGISSVSAAEEHYRNNGRSYPKSGRKKGNGRALNYMTKGVYTEDKLKELGISLGEEFYE